TMMTGEPVMNSSGPGAPSDAAMGRDREPGTRMAGMTSGMMPETTPVQDEEGVRSLRMFLEERNRTVPQPPPAVPSRDRRMQKSL
ncbi:MAG TPA: hypothetical protein VK689_18300, partial [Armatimonadota bacterium]|nr:hypothetical protein [Armatimonadota bacterium]